MWVGGSPADVMLTPQNILYLTDRKSWQTVYLTLCRDDVWNTSQRRSRVADDTLEKFLRTMKDVGCVKNYIILAFKWRSVIKKYGSSKIKSY